MNAEKALKKAAAYFTVFAVPIAGTVLSVVHPGWKEITLGALIGATIIFVKKLYKEEN